jgi:hypothetical protein
MLVVARTYPICTVLPSDCRKVNFSSIPAVSYTVDVPLRAGHGTFWSFFVNWADVTVGDTKAT